MSAIDDLPVEEVNTQHWLVNFLPLLDKYKSGQITEKGIVSYLQTIVLQPLYDAIPDVEEVKEDAIRSKIEKILNKWFHVNLKAVDELLNIYKQ